MIDSPFLPLRLVVDRDILIHWRPCIVIGILIEVSAWHCRKTMRRNRVLKDA